MLRLALAAAVFLSPLPAFAWGASGHSIVAELAQRRLTPAAATELSALIGSASLASLSSWADDYKFTPAGTKTKRWHYIDVPLGETIYSPARDCHASPEGDCLPEALSREIVVLSDPTQPLLARQQALKLVVHLVGDLSQPFHCAEAHGDAGGNAEQITLAGSGPDGKPRQLAMRLHALWDDGLIDAHTFSWGNFVDEIETAVMPSIRVSDFRTGAVMDWTTGCHAAGERLYAMMPAGWEAKLAAGQPIELPPTYQVEAQPILAAQLAVGGLELAAVLNAALGKR